MTIAWHLQHHPPHHLVEGNDLPHLASRRTRHPRTAQEATLQLHPLPSRATQRDLAVRLHPLAPRQRRRRRDPHLARRPLHFTPCQSPPTYEVTGRIVVDTFHAATEQHGIPFSTLTDNGLVFTTRFSQGGLTSRNGFETELVRLRVRQKNSRPNHPTTCGKVERFQQTMKRQARPTSSRNDRRPATATRSVHQRLQPPPPAPVTGAAPDPAVAYTARPKARQHRRRQRLRVRHDRVDKAGKVTLRHHGKLFHIGIGRTLAGTQIILLIHDLDIRIIHAATGEIIRTLTLDPEHQYQPTGKAGRTQPPLWPLQTTKQEAVRTLMGFGLSRMSHDIALVAGAGFEPATSGL
ncbi:MAG: DDE-type integrase/transposase/recombinase [Acidimicrobiaceae bacterium]|nr:DDE-type integrase/transposase/recombinase [Acidimicrobiaceae bacterium]